ncbi:uncharacterized protein [Dysidea avara]|uniref:uncharacterized protein isoform X2 n=1 Tax=Dysidea avara TaxID=196820 RepID=UPI0033242B1E
MSVLTRVELDGVITSISRRLVYYPACDLCTGKLTILQDGTQTRRCNDKRVENDVYYRYCLVLLVSDQSSAAHVTAFGNGWDKLFGATASKLHSILKEFSIQTSYEAVCQCFCDSVVATFVGQRFKFKFNVHLTKNIPRGLISFRTILANRVATSEHNLIATNFSLMDTKDFRSVLNILEAKLFQTAINNVKLNVSATRNGQLTHNTSYLFGSWLSDSVSQGIHLVSLDQDCKLTSQLISQNDLIDSVYWIWEATQDMPIIDEDIIQDVVSYLEESKNDFWNTESDPENSTDTICEETYSDSFMENFCMPTQYECALQGIGKNIGTPSTANIAPSRSDGYSPDLFASGIKPLNNGGTPKHISTPSKLVSPTRILFNESLNSPNLFSDQSSNTPTGSTCTNDFTSPALC